MTPLRVIEPVPRCREWLGRRHGRLFFSIIIVGTLARFSPQSIRRPDMLYADYIRMAAQILEGNRLSFGRAPLYPCFIAVFESLKLGLRGESTVVAQWLLGGWVLGMTYCIASALSSPLAGLFAALLLAFNPLYWKSCYALGLETFFSFLLLTAALQFVLWISRPTVTRGLMLAAAAGFCLSCRSTLVLFPVFLLAWRRIPGLRRELSGKRLWPFFVCYAAVLPWTAHNYMLYGRFIPFENGGGGLGVYVASQGELSWGERDGSQVQEQARKAFPELEGMDPGEVNQNLFRLSLRNIAAEPARYAASCIGRAALWLRYSPLLYSFLFGAIALGWRDPRICALASIPIYMALAHVPLALTERFLVPVVPVLCVLGGFFLDSLWSRPEPFLPAERFLRVVGGISLGTACFFYLIQLAVLAHEISLFYSHWPS